MLCNDYVTAVYFFILRQISFSAAGIVRPIVAIINPKAKKVIFRSGMVALPEQQGIAGKAIFLMVGITGLFLENYGLSAV